MIPATIDKIAIGDAFFISPPFVSLSISAEEENVKKRDRDTITVP